MLRSIFSIDMGEEGEITSSEYPVFDLELKPATPESKLNDLIGYTGEYLDEDGEIVEDSRKIESSEHLNLNIRSELVNELMEGGEATFIIPSSVNEITLTLGDENE